IRVPSGDHLGHSRCPFRTRALAVPPCWASGLQPSQVRIRSSPPVKLFASTGESHEVHMPSGEKPPHPALGRTWFCVPPVTDTDQRSQIGLLLPPLGSWKRTQ